MIWLYYCKAGMEIGRIFETWKMFCIAFLNIFWRNTSFSSCSAVKPFLRFKSYAFGDSDKIKYGVPREGDKYDPPSPTPRGRSERGGVHSSTCNSTTIFSPNKHYYHVLFGVRSYYNQLITCASWYRYERSAPLSYVIRRGAK